MPLKKDVRPIEVVRPRSWEPAGAEPDLESLDKGPAETEAPAGGEAAEREERPGPEEGAAPRAERGGEPS